MDSNSTSVSVVIPTFNRPKSLLRTLTSLAEQTYPCFEVLVVDNACSAEVQRLVDEAAFSFNYRLQYVPEKRLGVHHARHTGVAAARSELLLFTDDDATFSPGWVAAYVDAFRGNEQMAAAGGPVGASWEIPPPPWLTAFIGGDSTFYPLSIMDRGSDFLLQETGAFFFSVNMAIRRSVLIEAGGFRPEATGSSWVGDGETGLYLELWRRKMPIGYVPDALVLHHITSERLTVDYLRHRMRNEGAAGVFTRYHLRLPSRRRLLLDAVMLTVRSFPYWCASLICYRSNGLSAIRLHVRSADSFSQVRHTLRLMLDQRYRRIVQEPGFIRHAEGSDSET